MSWQKVLAIKQKTPEECWQILVACFMFPYTGFPSGPDNETMGSTEVVELSNAQIFDRNGYCKGLEKPIGNKNF